MADFSYYLSLGIDSIDTKRSFVPKLCLQTVWQLSDHAEHVLYGKWSSNKTRTFLLVKHSQRFLPNYSDDHQYCNVFPLCSEKQQILIKNLDNNLKRIRNYFFPFSSSFSLTLDSGIIVSMVFAIKKVKFYIFDTIAYTLYIIQGAPKVSRL